MADYEFRYAPLTGRITGKQMLEQTEQAINGLASLVDDAAGQVEIISTLANEANENAATALETAEEALATTGRTYITVSIPADANDYYDSQLIYIADNTSTNIPVADTGMLEVKTNDNKTACEQVFIADSSGEAYYRHGDITAETVGDVTTYTVTWGGWSSEPASQAYVQNEISGYLPLSGGTMTGSIVTNSPLKTPTDDTALGVYGGTDYDNGSALQVFGKDNASYPGWFSIRASDGVNNKIFVGKPDGTLTWSGQSIPDRSYGVSLTSTAGQNTYTFSVNTNGAVIFAKRGANCSCHMVTYWDSGSTKIFSTGTDPITITKSANSSSVTITNAYSSAIAIKIINGGTL